MREPPLVVLVLAGVAERASCPAARSPLALAATPHLDRLAAGGRVFSVRLASGDDDAGSAAPLLSLLGIDPAGVETARASYLGLLSGATLAPEECFLSADFVSLFRDLVADAEPGPIRPAEMESLFASARDAMARAGFHLVAGSGSRHVAIAPRASVDPRTPSPTHLLGKSIEDLAPRIEQHRFAHRLGREALDGHEVNAVRRDLGGNGADMVWLWGPGGVPRLERTWDLPVGAFGLDPLWRGVCKAAGVRLRASRARSTSRLLRALERGVSRDGICFVYARRGLRDALSRSAQLRVNGIAELDRRLVGPVAELVAGVGGRLLIVADAARETATAIAHGDSVPALLWGAGIAAVKRRPFHEAGAAGAGEPLEPGSGLLAYVRHL